MEPFVLRLSSPSFLETVLTHSPSGTPLYSTETYGNRTTLYRTAPHGLQLVAAISWPVFPHQPKKQLDAVSIQMHDWERPLSQEEFLKTSRLGYSKKFHMPSAPAPLKWKRTGQTFVCAAPGAPGALATFDPPVLTAHARLTLHTEPLDALLDYLVLTALLLTTHPDDWHGFAPAHLASSASSASASASPTPSPTSPFALDCPFRREPALVEPFVLPPPSPGTAKPPPHLHFIPEHPTERAPPVAHAPMDATFADEDEDEAPPPYDKIAWTVRVPRRMII